jgi:hypothetical protein
MSTNQEESFKIDNLQALTFQLAWPGRIDTINELCEPVLPE